MTYKTGIWDLGELVKDHHSKEFENSIKKIETKSRQFEKIKNQLKSSISKKDFLDIIKKIEDISEQTSIIGSYASLMYSSNTQSDEATSLLSRMTKIGSEIENRVLFFDLWWKTKIDEENANRLIQGSGQFKNYLKFKRLMAKHSLSESEERIINTLDVTGISALVKLYDKFTNAFVYEVKINGKKKKMCREELTGLVRSTNPKIREAAYTALLSKFYDNKGIIGEIYQNIVKNWRDEGIEIRKFSTPISIRNVSNDIDDKSVDVLLKVCKKNSHVFQEYFAQKAKMIGVKKLRRYDVYAPIKNTIKEKRFTYDKSIRLVLDALKEFSPELSEHAKRVIEQNHIDSSIRHGKRDGAFCSTPSPNISPYVLVNFTGKSRDVFTLAHELGHAVHSVAASDKSILVSDAPLPLAETASTFSELLLYDKLSNSGNTSQKSMMLAEKIDDLYATIGRQSYFTMFEVDAHNQIAQNTTVDEISKTYLQNIKEQFGNSVEVTDDFSLEWSAIPHFFHTPFYCYAYSFGNLLALSLFQRYKKEGNGFAKDYIQILAAGGSKKPEILLDEFGMDITESRFWQDGFDYVKDQVKTLSTLN